MTSNTQNSDNTDDDIKEVTRLLQVQMRNNALRHLHHIDARSVRQLERLGLFKGIAESIGDKVDITVLLDPEHQRRKNLPAGPLVLYATIEDESHCIVEELPVLLLSERLDVREAALTCIEQMIQDGALAVTPKTENILKDAHAGLISESAAEWRRAAVAAFDALYDDVLIALQGTRQILESDINIQDSLTFYAPRIIRPTISSLDSINMIIGDPEKEHERLTEVIRQIVAASQSIGDVCAGYYEKLGYLPLAPKYGLSEAVRCWLAIHAGVDVWKEVWVWAREAVGPVPRYHACCVFVSNPDLVPSGKLPDLWNEILKIVYESSSKGINEAGHEAWALRHDLVLHYTYHLEAHLPDSLGANIATFAWWFSEKVAALFPDTQSGARFYREKWVQPALELSTACWLVASAPVQRSFLRYMTFVSSSPWSLSLFSIMGDKLEQLAPNEQSDEVLAKFNDALVSQSIASLPFVVQNSSDPTFALQCSIADTVLKWAELQAEDQRMALQQLITTSQSLGTAEELCNALRKFAESQRTDQIAIALALKAKALTDPAIVEGVLEIISDEDWRLEVFRNVDAKLLDLLMEALSILQVDNHERFLLLPHHMADLCEKINDDARRCQLFSYVLLASLASGTVSAVQRLLRGTHKAKFLNLAKEYQERVEAMRANYPPWVAGKMRGLVASLRVV